MKLDESLLIDTVLAVYPLAISDEDARVLLSRVPSKMFQLFNMAGNHENAVKYADYIAAWCATETL